MLDVIRGSIESLGLPLKNRLLLVGVSGGIDSVAVLHLLKALGCAVICAHFDHQLRPDSDKDRDFVQQLAAEWQIPFVSGAEDVEAYRLAEHLSIEEAARTLRYRFLFAQARSLGAQAVVTGHNADDQAETVLMNLIRGAGLAGLKGMRPVSINRSFDPHLPIVRPLLRTLRAEVAAYQAEAGFPYREDPSNSDPGFFRNRIRSELLPLLAQYNPEIKVALGRTARILAEDEAALEELAGRFSAEAVRVGPKAVRLDLGRLRKCRRSMAARILRHTWQDFRPDLPGLDHEATRRALDLVWSARSTGSCDLLSGLRLIREYEAAWIAASPDDLPLDPFPQMDADLHPLPVPGRVPLLGGWWIEASLIEDLPPDWGGGSNKSEVYVAAGFGGSLRLRGRRRGDRIRPFGLGGRSMSLSDLMINEKLPQRTRAGWPLVVSGDRVLWVVGVELSADAAVDAASGPFIRLRLLRR